MARISILVAALAAVWGCSASTPAPTAQAPRQIAQLLTFYSQYQNGHGGLGPPDQAVLEKFVRDQGSAELERRGIEPAQLDQLFVSDRDHEPLVIRFGLRLADEKNGPQVVVYERSGVNSKRFVGFLNRRVEEVDSARAETLGLKLP